MLGFIGNRQITATQKLSASGSTRSQALPPDGDAAAAGTALTSDENPSDSALIVAQDIWGAGNLTPLDHLFCSTAIMNLVPKLSMGFIGRHLGRRLHRYSEDTGIWIDAFETDLVLSRLHKKKDSTIRLKEWNDNAALFKKSRYSTFIVVQASEICASLNTVYGQSANGLKADGRLFVADLMWSGVDSHGATRPGSVKGPGGQYLRTFDEHKGALAAAGLTIEGKYDLSDGLMSAVRNGFLQSLKTLSELRALNEPERSQRRFAFNAQLETWATLYILAQQRAISATAFLALKRGLPTIES